MGCQGRRGRQARLLTICRDMYLVSDTEIDWIAYMQEVGGFLEGERDYMKLKGDTGPLVYPAGFVYLYSVLYWVTGSGEKLVVVQWIFAALYVASLAVVMMAMKSSKFVGVCWTSLFGARMTSVCFSYLTTPSSYLRCRNVSIRSMC